MTASALAEKEEELRQRASELVAANWAAIERLAEELRSIKILQSDEAEFIIDVVRGEATEVDLTYFRAHNPHSRSP